MAYRIITLRMVSSDLQSHYNLLNSAIVAYNSSNALFVEYEINHSKSFTLTAYTKLKSLLKVTGSHINSTNMVTSEKQWKTDIHVYHFLVILNNMLHSMLCTHFITTAHYTTTNTHNALATEMTQYRNICSNTVQKLKQITETQR